MGEETDIVEPMSSEDVVAAEDVTADEPSKDQRRKRKKHLYKSLRELMEFYLGDANLNKDRFIAQLIQGQPFVYVDLSLFLTFNKVKSLTSSVQDLVKALSSSEILQVSEDGTRVCRKTPIGKKENEDDCTIYVEQLGPDVDHDLLTKVFSEFGPVDYVSIPRFPHNGKFKGFAFVEFKDVESAKKALEVLNARGCCLSPHMAPEELMSIKNFDEDKTVGKARFTEPKQTKDTNHSKKSHVAEESQSVDKEMIIKNTQNEKESIKKEKKKRKCSDDNEQLKKRLKPIEDDQSESVKDTTESEEKVLEKEIEERSDSELNDNATSKRSQGKKHKKITPEDITKEKQSKPCENKEVEIVQEEETSQVKKRKRKYSLEKDNSGKCDELTTEPADKKLKSDTEEGTDAELSHSEEDTREDDSVRQKKKRKKRKRAKKEKSSATSLGLKVLPKREWKQLRNKYLNMQRETMRSLKQHLSYSKWEKNKPTVTEPEESACKRDDTFTVGTVVKVTLDEAVSNTKAAKSEMRIHPDIRYVDVTEGSTCVYLRTSTSELALSLVQSKHWPSMEVIQGEEETQYWNKIKIDREHLKKNKPNQRGRTKLLKRAERYQSKHITVFESC